MDNQILIGKIVKAQGIKGEVKVQPITSNIQRFTQLSYAIIDNETYNVKHIRIGIDNFVYITFDEVTDRNSAEALRNKELYVNKQDRVKISSDQLFIDDLMNSIVKDENGDELGEVINVENYGATDIITVSQGMGITFAFPLLKAVVISFDADAKLLVLDSLKLAEIKI